LDTNPQISVIIPTLNEEKLILQTLRQFTPDIRNRFGIELIVSDGGSTDSTLSIVESNSLADKIIKAVPGEKQNIPQGRNAGASTASGKYFYFFNADTLINNIEQFFTSSTECFEKDAFAALTCKIRVFPDDVRLSDRMFHGFYNSYVRILNKAGMGMGRGECHMVRKEIFKSVGGYNEMLAAGEDYDLYRRIAKQGKIKFISGLTVYESPRRYRKFGYRKVFGDWTNNSLSVLFKNRSVSKEWDPVR
jgi:glycosyltransferase involved in cell wall biosynthesis